MRTMTAAIGSAAFLVIAPGVSGQAGSLVADRMADGRRLSGAGADHWRGGDRCGPRCAPGRVRQFAIQGRGTPAPPAPPGQPVVRGLYRYVRNPVYLAVPAVTTGQALLLNHPILLGYAAAVAAAFIAFIYGYEQPTLARRYGAQYQAYRQDVPGWWPRLRPARTARPR